MNISLAVFNAPVTSCCCLTGLMGQGTRPEYRAISPEQPANDWRLP